MYGRHGEAPRARSSPPTRPSHCFDAAIEAVRLAVTYRTPVILLSDGYLANGSEPWRLPDVDAAAGRSSPDFATETNHIDADGEPEVLALPPRSRDPGPALGACPACPGLEHRIGGLEKADGSGNISYDPANHERMVHLRAAKIAGIARDLPPVEVDERRPATPSCWWWAGARPRAPSRPASTGCGRGVARWPTST